MTTSTLHRVRWSKHALGLPGDRLAAPAMIPAVLLMGPTAPGKSALALALAERFDGEIVSVDSAQVYRGMDIGTAKPTPRRARASRIT